MNDRLQIRRRDRFRRFRSLLEEHAGIAVQVVEDAPLREKGNATFARAGARRPSGVERARGDRRGTDCGLKEG
jgi:hypothetical protein